jgi:hypothetical protein
MPSVIAYDSPMMGTSSSSITSATLTTAGVWTIWNMSYLTSSTLLTTSTTTVASINTIWTNWCLTSSSTVTPSSDLWRYWNISNIPQNLSAAQIAENRRQADESAARYHAERERAQLQRSLAEKRAEKLLQQSLNDRQREELSSKGFFTLRTVAENREERFYRIRRGRSRNIEQVDASGRHLKTLCAHPAENVPDADTMLVQKLMLEAKEPEFLRIANHSY